MDDLQFETVRVISDKGRRWEHLQNVCKQLNLPCTHAPAVFLNDEEAKECVTRNLDGNGGEFTKGAVGCYLAHKQVWDDIATGVDGWHLVMEDDVALPLEGADKAKEDMIHAINQAGDAEFIQFAHMKDKRKLANRMNLSAYALRPIGAEKLSNLAPSCGSISKPIDHISAGACVENQMHCAPLPVDLQNSKNTWGGGTHKQMKRSKENPSLIRGEGQYWH